LPNRCDDEPDFPKICVAPTVPGCLVALPASCWYSMIYVYRTAEPVRSVKPWDVVDADVTGERWIVEDCDFIQVGKICAKQLKEIRGRVRKDAGYYFPGMINSTYTQRKARKIIEKYIEFP